MRWLSPPDSVPEARPSVRYFTDISDTSPIWLPPTFTHSASGLSRWPVQAAQGMSVKYFEISSRAHSDSVSRQRRSRLVTTPSKLLRVS
jgi:hypothetical protein